MVGVRAWVKVTTTVNVRVARDAVIESVDYVKEPVVILGLAE